MFPQPEQVRGHAWPGAKAPPQKEQCEFLIVTIVRLDQNEVLAHPPALAGDPRRERTGDRRQGAARRDVPFARRADFPP
ncbi:hypothetical protein GCM10022252_60640 [Streptosporangium oxazolinicum]|uniref:Uncharacterized protein n=1 Tax=Streptosporangium oxazolinicum TaxID=909287 RepID=A0ABP8BCC9_9ACTN